MNLITSIDSAFEILADNFNVVFPIKNRFLQQTANKHLGILIKSNAQTIRKHLSKTFITANRSRRPIMKNINDRIAGIDITKSKKLRPNRCNVNHQSSCKNKTSKMWKIKKNTRISNAVIQHNLARR